MGEIKLTIAKFYRISGGSTQHKGVEADITMPSMIDTARIGEDTYTSSLPWSTISPSFYTLAAEINPGKIEILRQKFQERSAKNPLYQSYLRDLDTLDQIRKKKTVSLQDATAKSETETIKRIEKEWVKEPDSTR